jgi:hypothetical protein
MGLQHEALLAWGTIAAVANQLDNVASLTKEEKTEQIVLALIKPVNDKLDWFVKTQSALLSSEVNYVKALLGTLVRKLRIDEMTSLVNELRSRTAPGSTG